MKTLSMVGGAIGIAVLGGFSALGVQSLFTKQPPPVAAVEPSQAPVITPPPPAAAVLAPTVTELAPSPAPLAETELAVSAPAAAPALAQIINVKPHFVTVKKPVRECYQTRKVYYVQPQPGVPGAGAVLGGVAGGLAGSAVHGKNHTAAVIAGAALGAVSGGAVQRNINQPVPQYVYSKQCDTHYVSSKVKKGYEVTYFYNGQQGTLLMENPPIGTTMPAPYLD